MKSILDYLDNTVKNYGEKTAVDDGNICMTWQELQMLSKQIGTVLCAKTDSENPIAIVADKSAVTLAVMFGVVYAGCYYVMVDPKQPLDRMQDIFSVLSPKIIITCAENEKLIDETGYGDRKCLFEEIMQDDIDDKRLMAIRKKCKEEDILYGIFTSGSTGKPKCIVVSHKSVIDFIGHFSRTFNFTDKDIVGNQAPFDFDVSVKDIYSCVMTGAELVIIPTKLFSVPPKLLDYICEKHINSLVWAVSALTLVSCLKGLNYRVPVEVKRVMFSGEVMPIKQLKLWQQALPDAEFVNLYGPSEITCNCMYYRVDRTFEDNELLPLGKAFEGRKILLMDENGHEINNPGVTGEICVVGESLARGYYNNKTETDRKFRQIDINGETKRCYFTGDMARYDEAGNLFFAGRKDFQIKHMGHRIELEEIEHALNQLPGVEKSCCFMNKKRNRLVGFYLGNAKENEIKSSLKRKLPTYMIPHTIVKVEDMPLNKNGKTDRKYFMSRQEVLM